MNIFINYKNTRYVIKSWNEYEHEEGEIFDIDVSIDPFVVRAFEMFNNRNATNDRNEYILFYKRLQTKPQIFVTQLKRISEELHHVKLIELCDIVLLEMSLRDFKF